MQSLTSSGQASMAQLEALEHRRATNQNFNMHQRCDDEPDASAAPRFVSNARSLNNMVEGQRAHFEAKLEPLGDPNLHVEWFKDGRPVLIGHRFRPIHDFGYVAMDIVDLISEDSGTYTIRATNSAGSAEQVVTLQCKSKLCLCFLLVCI